MRPVLVRAAIQGLVAIPSDDTFWIGWTSKFAFSLLLLCIFPDGFPGKLLLRSSLASGIAIGHMAMSGTRQLCGSRGDYGK